MLEQCAIAEWPIPPMIVAITEVTIERVLIANQHM